MKNLILLIIPLLLLSSCSINWNDEKDNKIIESKQQIQESQNQIGLKILPINSDTISQDFWSGFILSQVDDKTVLTYSGRIVTTWQHTPPEKVPFIWDEACVDFFEAMDMIDSEERNRNPNWKQIAWERFDANSKKLCMKEYLWKSIRTEQLNSRFFNIIQANYETYESWVFDIKTGNIQKMPTMWALKLTQSESWTTIFIDMLYGDDNMKLIYDVSFSQLLSKEEIPKI
jgi:hypothetical protein